MEPKMTVTLSVRTPKAGEGAPGLLVSLAGGDKFHIPLTEKPAVIAGLVRELAGLVVEHARRQVEAAAEALRAGLGCAP
jgi:hypothetical protein